MTHAQGPAPSGFDKTRSTSPIPEAFANLRERLAGGDLATVTVLGPTSDASWRAHPIPATRFLAAVHTSSAVVLPPAHLLRPSGPRQQQAKQFEASHLAVDLSTLRAATWSPGTAVALADACTSKGRVHPESPRHLLERLIARLEAYGVRVTVAVETQLRLTGAASPDDSGLDAVLVHLCSLLRHADLPVESISTAPSLHAPDRNGQLVTATFAHRDPLTACDNHVLHHLAATIHSEYHGLHTESASTDRLTLHLTLTAPGQTTNALIDMAHAGLQGEIGNIAANLTGRAPFLTHITEPDENARRTTEPAGSTVVKINSSADVITLTFSAATGVHEATVAALTGITAGIRHRHSYAATTAAPLPAQPLRLPGT
ncbi:hypothetical protein OG900_09340 [Streptomyces sp. NBC_00433]